MKRSSPSSLPESHTAVNPEAPPRGVILLADDEAVSRDLLKELLSMSGFEVAAAADGAEAIDLFLQLKPDVVVTDIRMPLKDGLQVLAEVRQIDDTTPVVMVTGYGDLDSAVNALRQGAHDYLLKPINADLLIDAVTKGVEVARLKRLERDYRRVLEEQVQERTKELAETNDFLSGILNSSRGVSIILTDLEGVIKFWNVGAENIYGYASEEMLGQHILQLFPERDYGLQTLAAMNRMIREEKKTIQQHVRRRAKDGRELTIFMTMSPMVDDTGSIKGILSLGQDMTEQVRLHQDLRRSYEKIRRIQGAFIFALAHLAESRDTETALHLKGIQAYCKVLCEQLIAAGAYHD
ncbi:MAG: response regulator, partial [Desulfomonilaceae bacterium]